MTDSMHHVSVATLLHGELSRAGLLGMIYAKNTPKRHTKQSITIVFSAVMFYSLTQVSDWLSLGPVLSCPAAHRP